MLEFSIMVVQLYLMSDLKFSVTIDMTNTFVLEFSMIMIHAYNTGI